MYGLLTTTLFRIPNDPGPVAIYNPPPVAIVNTDGTPVLNAAGMPTFHAQQDVTRTEQATINANFKRAKHYWDSYQNIRHAVFNILDDIIDDAFKVSKDPALTRWNQSMEPREMFDQITMTYGHPTPQALLQNDTLF